MGERFRRFVDRLDEWFEDHDDLLEKVRVALIGYNLATDVQTVRKLVIAIHEGNARQASWHAFNLGIAASAYLRMIRDYLGRFNDEDDGDDGDEEPGGGDDGPPGGMTKKVVLGLMGEFLERERLVAGAKDPLDRQ